MKNYYLFVIAITLCTNALILHSQNYLSPTTLTFTDTTDVFQRGIPDEFVIGWNWGGMTPRLDTSFKINYKHTGYQLEWYGDTNRITDNQKLIWHLPGLGGKLQRHSSNFLYSIEIRERYT
ncbi:MAG: hypothetical protein V1779_09055 [bacterium]